MLLASKRILPPTSRRGGARVFVSPWCGVPSKLEQGSSFLYPLDPVKENLDDSMSPVLVYFRVTSFLSCHGAGNIEHKGGKIDDQHWHHRLLETEHSASQGVVGPDHNGNHIFRNSISTFTPSLASRAGFDYTVTVSSTTSDVQLFL